MKYEDIKNLNNEEFKHLIGVSIQTFNDMVKVVKDFVLINKKTGLMINSKRRRKSLSTNGW